MRDEQEIHVRRRKGLQIDASRVRIQCLARYIRYTRYKTQKCSRANYVQA
jgi:hypothetical protein